MNRHAIVKYVSEKLGFEIPLIDGAKKLQQIEYSIESFKDKGVKVVALANVLPPNIKYLDMGLCGENYMYPLKTKYHVKVWGKDFGVAFIFLEVWKEEMPNEIDLSYKTLQSLKNKLHIVEDEIVLISPFDKEMASDKPEPTVLAIDLDEIPINLDSCSDEELRDLYEEKFGKKAGGRTKRETLIQKLSE